MVGGAVVSAQLLVMAQRTLADYSSVMGGLQRSTGQWEAAAVVVWGSVITLKRDEPWKVRLAREALLFPASIFFTESPHFHHLTQTNDIYLL